MERFWHMVASLPEGGLAAVGFMLPGLVTASPSLSVQVTSCLLGYLLYIVPVAAVLVVVHKVLRVPRELFRKLLHMAAFSSAPVVMWLSGSWFVALVTLVTFGLVVWPVLVLLERLPWYADLFVERRSHEVRRSLLLLFLGNALLVALCWGLFGQPMCAVAAILMWGFGDAAAALVGTRWGRHHTRIPLADERKTWEGTAAMFCVGWVVGVAVLLAFGQASPATCVLRAGVTAAVGAYVELITHRGYDTVTVPFANAATLLLLVLA